MKINESQSPSRSNVLSKNPPSIPLGFKLGDKGNIFVVVIVDVVDVDIVDVDDDGEGDDSTDGDGVEDEPIVNDGIVDDPFVIETVVVDNDVAVVEIVVKDGSINDKWGWSISSIIVEWIGWDETEEFCSK